MARWQAKLENKQTFLGRIVDIGAELFAISATVVYADTIGREQPERKDEAIELAQLFCSMAKRRADTLFGELWANDDDARYARRAEGAGRPLRVARGRNPRPGRRRSDDAAARRLGERNHHGHGNQRADRLDGRRVGRSGWTASCSARQEASKALRELDQEAVDRIVWAMTVAGLENAVELAELAMEETHFGVFEDKVLKNYIATEFLYDYLKDKKSVGVIDEDRERALQYVAEPIGVVLALLPITNPTSTTLFKSIVCAKTRNALIMRPSPRAARCAVARGGAAPGGRRGGGPAPERAPGDPRPVARRLAVPVPPPRRRLHLDDRRAEGGRGRQRRRQAVPERRPGQRARVRPPQRRHPDGGHGHARSRRRSTPR